MKLLSCRTPKPAMLLIHKYPSKSWKLISLNRLWPNLSHDKSPERCSCGEKKGGKRRGKIFPWWIGGDIISRHKDPRIFLQSRRRQRYLNNPSPNQNAYWLIHQTLLCLRYSQSFRGTVQQELFFKTPKYSLTHESGLVRFESPDWFCLGIPEVASSLPLDRPKH